MSVLRKGLEDRFWEKVQKTEDCWLWTAAQIGSGYGQFRLGGYAYAHRYSYELHKGKIPEGLHIDHLCRVKNCVNPDHLEAVSPGENLRRGIRTNQHKGKTHCIRGHEFSGDNLILGKNGGRHCRTCTKMKRRERLKQCQQAD